MVVQWATIIPCLIDREILNHDFSWALDSMEMDTFDTLLLLPYLHVKHNRSGSLWHTTSTYQNIGLWSVSIRGDVVFYVGGANEIA